MSISKLIANLLFFLLYWSLEESSSSVMPEGTGGETWVGIKLTYGGQQQLCQCRGETSTWQMWILKIKLLKVTQALDFAKHMVPPQPNQYYHKNV